jgi:hypothetical protein
LKISILKISVSKISILNSIGFKILNQQKSKTIEILLDKVEDYRKATVELAKLSVDISTDGPSSTSGLRISIFCCFVQIINFTVTFNWSNLDNFYFASSSWRSYIYNIKFIISL